MFRLTYKNLLANKVRFALTTFGVILAVSFVVSAFVLGDGLRSSFTKVSEDVTAGVDLEVRGVADFGDAPPLPADTVSVVAAVDGVADAVPNIEAADNAVRPIRANGESIPTDRSTAAGVQLDRQPTAEPVHAGRRCAAAGRAVHDGRRFCRQVRLRHRRHATRSMVPDGSVDLTLSGTSSFGADNSTLGAVLMQMNTDQASDLFGIDGINNVAVQVADGADVADVQAAVAAAVPTAEVVDHATVLAETTSGFTKEIDVVGNILLGFGGVALFVSIFIIYNTFAIVHVAAQPRARAAAHRRCRARSRSGGRCWVRRWSWACSPRSGGSSAASPSPRASMPCSALSASTSPITR